ncbi:MAG: hypothetical protein CMJ48_06605 [Planctomycetaceae bacterium]|nr:hypothetical protein [Planctomycetaceae bacterium]
MSAASPDDQLSAGAYRRRVVVRIALVAVGLGLWFLTQSLIGNRPAPTDGFELLGAHLTRGDALLTATEPVNRFLNENTVWARALLISSSAIIDLLGIFLIARALFGPTFRPFLGLLMLFALRQLSQALCILPAPEMIIWESPGFPSLLVTYGVANDFFFSGHTGIAVFGAVELGRLNGRSGVVLGTLVALYEASAVLLLRAHYTMDVLTGILAALCVASAAAHLAPRVDEAIERLCTRSG